MAHNAGARGGGLGARAVWLLVALALTEGAAFAQGIDGNGIKDEAWLLLSTDGKGFGVFAFMGTRSNQSKIIHSVLVGCESAEIRTDIDERLTPCSLDSTGH